MFAIAPALIFALLGLAIGSVVVHVAEAALAKRSLSAPHCPYCTQAYAPIQRSAALALLTGHWRCRACGRPLRLPRLLGEVFLAATWGLLAGRYGLDARSLLAMAALIPQAMVLVTDIEAKLIPNRIILPALAAMVVVGTLVGPAVPFLQPGQWWSTLAGAGVGFVVFRLLVWLGVAIFGEGALGEGDITLATYVGAVVGFPLIFEALLLAFILGGLGALVVLLVRRGTLRTTMPYGPFIILGCAATLIWGFEIMAWFLS